MKDAATLSGRELEVARLIAWGLTKKEIAYLLIISERTVENHTRSIYKKLKISKSSELSAWYFCVTYQIPFSESPITKTNFPQLKQPQQQWK
jgi:DNA-binding NarL/FixJ family response regulator